MAIGDDFEIQTNGNIRHTSGTTRYTVLELHRWLQDLADNATSTGDDNLDILKTNPSVRSTNRDITLNSPFNIDDTAAQYLTAGSISQDNSDELYAGVALQFLVTPFTTDVYILQNGSKVNLPKPDGNSVTDSANFLLKVKTGGTLIDSGVARFFTRDLGNTYSDFVVDLSGGNLTTVVLGPGSDANVESTGGATYAATLAGMTFTFGATSQDVGNGNGSQPYSVRINVGTGVSPLQAYQALQYATRDGAVTTYNSTQGQFYRFTDSGFTPVPSAPFGVFAGGKLTAAQGVWFEGFDAQYAQDFVPQDDNGVIQTPPVSVPVSVTGIVSGDRVLVTIGSSDTPTLTTYSAAAGNTSGNGTFVVKETIATDLPSSGVVRVLTSTGTYERYTYSAYSGSTFTLTGTLSETVTEDNNAFVPYIDEVATTTSVSKTIVYSADRSLIVRVRNGSGTPIVPFTVDASLTNTGVSVTAVRNSDVT